MKDYSDITPLLDLFAERERILTEGTVEEVLDLAKEFHVNQNIEVSTTYYKEMVQRIKNKCAKLNIDYTNI